jgi:hypothetical protein
MERDEELSRRLSGASSAMQSVSSSPSRAVQYLLYIQARALCTCLKTIQIARLSLQDALFRIDKTFSCVPASLRHEANVVCTNNSYTTSPSSTFYRADLIADLKGKI